MHPLPLPGRPLTEADILQVASAFVLWGIALALAVLSLLPARISALRIHGPGLRRLYRFYPLILLAVLAVWRAPGLVYNGENDVDESAFLVFARQYQSDPVPWRSVDTQTSGPLNAYLLEWPSLAGQPLSYRTLALTGFACIFLTLLLQLKSVALILGRRRALAVIAAAATFYAFAWHFDLERYPSEHLSVLLMTAAGWLMLALHRRPGVAKALFIGFLLGAVPFAKLQASPIAVYLFAVAVALLLTMSADKLPSPGDRIRHLLALAAGGLVVPLAVMTPVIATGTWPEFLQRYILNGLHYNSDMLSSEHPSYLRHAIWFLRVNPFLVVMLFFGASLAAMKWAYRTGPIDRKWLAGLAAVLGYVCISLLVVLKPRLNFLHYNFLLTTPLVLFAAWTIRGTTGAVRAPTLARNSGSVIFVLLALCVALELANYGLHRREHLRFSDRPAANEAVSQIDALSSPGDTLAIWGWTPDMYVLTGLRPGTREVNGLYIVSPGTQYDSFRSDFIADMEKNKPRFFVDSAGANDYPDGWPHPAEKARYTNYPAVAAYINAHYTLHSQVDAYEKGPPVLIYLRNNQP